MGLMDKIVAKKTNRTWKKTSKSNLSPVEAFKAGLLNQRTYALEGITSPKQKRLWYRNDGGQFYTKLGSAYLIEIEGATVFGPFDTLQELASFYDAIVVAVNSNEGGLETEIKKKSAAYVAARKKK